MQLALAAVTKVFGALAGTAGAVGTTTSAGLSAGQIGLTALKVIGGLGAGMAAASEARSMADQMDLQSGQEQVASTQRQTDMKRSLLKALGENDVTFAAAGIDISQGIAASSAADAKKRASQEISIERQDSDFRRAQYRARGQGYRNKAKGAIGGALLGAIGDVAGAGIDLRSRDVTTPAAKVDRWKDLR